jgi:hypothetical protein
VVDRHGTGHRKEQVPQSMENGCLGVAWDVGGLRQVFEGSSDRYRWGGDRLRDGGCRMEGWDGMR